MPSEKCQLNISKRLGIFIGWFQFYNDPAFPQSFSLYWFNSDFIRVLSHAYMGINSASTSLSIIFLYWFILFFILYTCFSHACMRISSASIFCNGQRSQYWCAKRLINHFSLNMGLIHGLIFLPLFKVIYKKLIMFFTYYFKLPCHELFPTHD